MCASAEALPDGQLLLWLRATQRLVEAQGLLLLGGAKGLGPPP